MCIVYSSVKPINSLLAQIAIMDEEVAQLRCDWEYELMMQADPDTEVMMRLREAQDYRKMLREARMALIRARDAARG